MLQEDYQINIENFHGPLDLLLYLIRRAEVDVNDIPIATITDQYLGFLAQLEDIDIDSAGEFLVMAATLIEIKSRVLMPAEARQGGEDETAGADAAGLDAADPRYELVQQLLAYQKYRVASEELEQRRQAFMQRFTAKPARVKREAEPDSDDDAPEPVEIELEDAHVFDLSEAYERIMASIDITRLGEHTVEVDDTPIALHQEDLLDRLSRARGRRLTLQEAFEAQSVGQRIGMFLATLELVRLRRVTVVQEGVLDDVILILNSDPEDAPLPNAPAAPA